jgi:SAM-dependent methyltransferase
MTPTPPPDGLAFTGERFVPGTRGEIWIEHWHRYLFAARFAAGKRVVDAACGEGYGSALLARAAAHVTGADISAQAVAHARATYADRPNLAFVEASCDRLPLEDASVDLFVTFETVEHITAQEAFVDEIARVLRPDGVLLISCPNKLEYSDRRQFANAFHVKELYREEMESLLARRFPHARWYGQRPSFFSVIAPEPRAESGEVFEVRQEDPAQAATALASPLYFLAAASRSQAVVHALPATLSVLADRDDWVHRDYEKVMRMMQDASRHGERLQAALDERERTMLATMSELAHSHAQLEAARERERTAQAAREAERQAGAEAIAQRDREILRRRGIRWWLRLPFVRLGLLDEGRP